MIRRMMMLALPCGVALILAGCSTTPSATVTSVSVTGPSLTAGASAQFTAIALMSDGTTQDVTSASAWQSSNTAVATVSAAGLVTGLADGQTTITATYQGMAGTDVAQIAG